LLGYAFFGERLFKNFRQLISSFGMLQVTRRASDQYTKPRLPRLLRYGRHVVTTWLQAVHGQEGGVNSSRAVWASRVDASVLEAFSASRISELYAIITEYPDSAPALEELQRALEVCNCCLT
jgi:hypothetical protein